jgi:threonine synthase
MKYISTRGSAPELGFEDVVIAGLASDGGLYVPEEYPAFTPAKIASFAGLSYEDLFFEVTRPFIDGAIPEDVLKKIIHDSYASFRHKAVAPLKQIGNQEFLLELFHGPTLAFKDFALQFLGRVFDYILTKRGQDVVIVGATSGDTGSAAIEGCRHSKHVQIFIMHPHKRVSEVQRRQMTTILADNVHNIALEGNFDDCQQIVKELFVDQSFLNGKQLVAVNSINWCRIMAQVVYYFYAGVQLGAPAKSVAFSVPTGNFGDIFAGYIAYKMGLPITQLVIATNKNDILHRFLENNDYSRSALLHSLSPSMDIQVSSNFERLLFSLYQNDGQAIKKLMDDFTQGNLRIDSHILAQARKIFSSQNVSDDDTCKIIKDMFTQTGEVLDPHTAIGVFAARAKRKNSHIPIVTLATAHPAKFSEAIEKSGLAAAQLPDYLSDLYRCEEKYQIAPRDISEIKKIISTTAT